VTREAPQVDARRRASPDTRVGHILAATKLQIPPPRPRSVPRKQLVADLIAGSGTKLTLLDAPPGSGKTSLLVEWHADPDERRPFAWISLERADNDPVRFWDGLIAALQTVAVDLGVQAQSALHSPGSTLENHVLPLLVNDLAALAEPLVLVLDDYHVIEKAQIHQAIELLVERLPPSAHLVLATRSDPPLALSRLRARGQLTEIRADDLRFSEAEAGLFLNEVLRLELADEQVAILNGRTEGWAAGLQLAGLSLRGRGDRQGFIDSFAGDDQQIVDYLGFEVLGRQPHGVREFLLRTSILDRLSGPLCATVTGAEDAELLLRQLERENLFVVPLDSRRQWYRYHHLFAEMLRHELLRTTPELVGTLHRRAAAWYRNEGAVHEAIEHATAGNDFEDAIDLITGHWYEFLQRGRQETIAAWIERLPAETVAANPDLCLTRAWLGVNAGRLDEVDRWTEAAGRAATERPDPVGMAPLASGVASLRAIHRYMEGDVRGAVAAGRHALALEEGRPESPWRPVGCPVLGLSLHWHGRSEDALETLSEAVRTASANDNHLAAMHASGGLAAIAYRRGDLAAARDHAAAAGRIAEEHALEEHWARSLSLAVGGQLLALRGELDAADRSVTRAAELAQRGVASLEVAYSLLILAAVRHGLGRAEDARSLHEQARVAVRRCADPGLLGNELVHSERRLQPSGRGASPRAGTVREGLTAAELNVLRLLRSELSQREIGDELHLSLNTIKTHTRNIYRKLQAATRAEAVAHARELSLL
jgi:LuxR family maltose regulon positive regulatory protein